MQGAAGGVQSASSRTVGLGGRLGLSLRTLDQIESRSKNRSVQCCYRCKYGCMKLSRDIHCLRQEPLIDGLPKERY